MYNKTIMELNRLKIKLEMERLGWRQSDLAKRMDMNRQQLNPILKDGSTVGVSFNMVNRLAAALGLDPKDLLK